MKRRSNAFLALVATLMCSAPLSTTAFAQPIGGGGTTSGGDRDGGITVTKTTCGWVTIPTIVIDGYTSSGFPILKTVYIQKLFCK